MCWKFENKSSTHCSYAVTLFCLPLDLWPSAGKWLALTFVRSKVSSPLCRNVQKLLYMGEVNFKSASITQINIKQSIHVSLYILIGYWSTKGCIYISPYLSTALGIHWMTIFICFKASEQLSSHKQNSLFSCTSLDFKAWNLDLEHEKKWVQQGACQISFSSDLN